MMAATHMLAGAAAGLLIAQAHPQHNPLLLSTMAALAAVLPDIDHPQSWIGRRFVLLSWIVGSLTNHRGMTHTILMLAIVTGVSYAVAPAIEFSFAIALGYASHLLLDMLTVSGVPLLAPATWRRLRVPVVRTGGLAEGVVMLLLFLLSAVLIA